MDVKDVYNELAVQSSKTDQTDEGKSLYIGDSTRRAIRNYAKRGGVEAGALFRRIRRRWEDPKMPAHYASAELAERGAIARFKYGK